MSKWRRAVENLENGFFGRLFTSYEAVDRAWRGGAIYGAFSRMRSSRVMSSAGRFVSRSIEDSLIVRCVNRIASALPRTTVRSYGTFLFSFGFYTSIIYAIKQVATTLTADTDALVSGLIFMLLSVPLLFSGKTLAAAVSSSRFISYIAFDILGYRREEASSKGRVYRRADTSFILGMILGLFSFYFSPGRIIGVLLSLVMFYVIMSKPETGIILLYALFPFLSQHQLAIFITITSISYVVKLICGRRTLRLDTADMLAAIFLVLTAMSGVIHYGAGTDLHTGTAHRVIFMVAYFLTSNLITNSAWRSRLIRALMFGGSALAVISICSLFGDRVTALTLGVGSNNIAELSGWFGEITTQALNSSYYLAMMIPVMMAYLMRRGSGGKWFNMLCFLILTLTAAAFTMSRGIWLGAVAGAVLMLVIFDLRFAWLPVAAAAIAPITVLLLPENARTWVYSVLDISGYLTQGRAEVRRVSAGIFFDNLLGGIGGGDSVFSSVYDAYTSVGAAADNSQNLFLQIGIELGIAGILTFLLSMVFLLMKAFSGCRYGPDRARRLCSGALAAGVFAALFCGMSSCIWLDERMFLLFWMYAGAVSAYNGSAFLRQDDVPFAGVVTGGADTASIDIAY